MHNVALKFGSIVAVSLVLAGCKTTEDQRAADYEKCASYGYERGSTAFADCMMDQDRQRDRDQRRTMRWLERQDREDRARRDAFNASADSSMIDRRPQFDKDGNPNFDAQGNYIGCHGLGCQVDNPDK